MICFVSVLRFYGLLSSKITPHFQLVPMSKVEQSCGAAFTVPKKSYNIRTFQLCTIFITKTDSKSTYDAGNEFSDYKIARKHVS